VIAEQLDVARAALRSKSKEAIEAETAATWGARAVAAYELYRQTGDVRWMLEAEDYRHESLEHGAFGPSGTLETIRAELRNLLG
jgi:hypothetical protein